MTTDPARGTPSSQFSSASTQHASRSPRHALILARNDFRIIFQAWIYCIQISGLLDAVERDVFAPELPFRECRVEAWLLWRKLASVEAPRAIGRGASLRATRCTCCIRGVCRAFVCCGIILEFVRDAYKLEIRFESVGELIVLIVSQKLAVYNR
jgi:hypothetical protein